MVTTAAGAAETLTAVQAGPGTGGLAMNVNTKRCHAVRARVPLGPDGLSGGTPTGGDATCLSPARLLVHLHLLTSGRVTWTKQPPFRIAHGTVLEAAVAVRATARKPLAYFTLDRKAFAHFYSAASCY